MQGCTVKDTASEISQKILFVDDEHLLLEGIKRQLRREFDIFIAEGGEAGLAILSEQGPFAVVVSDYNMPGMDGIQFLSRVRECHPQTVLIMLTGRADLDIAMDALHHAQISRFLNKPCPKLVLQDTLKDGIEQYRLRRSEQLLQTQLKQANQALNTLNGQLEALVAEKTRALSIQYAYVANMAQMQNSLAVISGLIQTVQTLTGIPPIGLWLSPNLDHQFECRYPNDITEVTRSRRLTLSNGMIAKFTDSNSRWLTADDLQTDIELAECLIETTSAMALPLKSKQGLLGFLTLASEFVNCASDRIDALFSILDVTTTALQSHWHREAFEDAQDAIITALAKLSEYRDPETGAHLLRIKKYCTLICQELSQSADYQSMVTARFSEDLVRSSPLHDIGKVGIPDAILKKPGQLSEDEFEIMKTHARIGGDTLKAVYDQFPSQSFIKCGMDIANCHHEKWNGSGYPLGLSGNDIPLSARILALVDVYDALTCRRVYKDPFPREKAKKIVMEGSGNHFDPGIVAAFLRIENDFFQIAQQYADVV